MIYGNISPKRHDVAEPTWINLIRDPITWYESSFYFKRLGWSQKPGARRRNDTEVGFPINHSANSAILIHWACSQISIILKTLERLLLNSVLKKNFRIVYSQTGNIFNSFAGAPTWRSVDSGMWSNDNWGTRTKLDGPKESPLWTQNWSQKVRWKLKKDH